MSLYTSEQWQNTARQTLEAAKRLFEAGQYRDCASRAYYAAYQAATAVCVKHGDAVNFPRDWNNPSHEQLPKLIQRNRDISRKARYEVHRNLLFLRAAREDSDYRPGVIVDRLMAYDCLRNLTNLLRYLE